jgi:hypothetical protein
MIMLMYIALTPESLVNLYKHNGGDRSVKRSKHRKRRMELVVEIPGTFPLSDAHIFH